MRIFIGFQWKAGDGVLTTVPVMYGDMSRQVANIIKENSENKLPTVPRIACYISGLELDRGRLSDPSFVSKVNIRERAYDYDEAGNVEYQNYQGNNYTVERIMPTPFKLSMKADLWTSSIDQKLQLFEQIMVLFNPSLEVQTTDNYIDWTSLSVVDLGAVNFSSRTIPAGAETEIDILSMDFEIPIYISPPAKVKKLGVVKSVIANIFADDGSVIDLEDLILNQSTGSAQFNSSRYGVLLFKSLNGQDNDYDLTLIDPPAAVQALSIPEKDIKLGGRLNWYQVLEAEGGYTNTSRVYFTQPNGFEISGTFAVNPVDPTVLVVSFDPDTIVQNTLITSSISGVSARGTVDAIVDPYKFNPLTRVNGRVLGVRYLMLDDVNPDDANSDGPDAWKNLNGSDPEIKANSIIEWTGSSWTTLFDPSDTELESVVIQNLKTLIKYRWDGEQWLKAFEGEYSPGYWRFDLSDC
jgi:hypothetical protein